MRYPNKNVGRWEGNAAPPDEPDDIQCTDVVGVHSTFAVTWYQCKNLVPEWDGDEEPLCEEHNEYAQQMDKADNQRKQQLED